MNPVAQRRRLAVCGTQFFRTVFIGVGIFSSENFENYRRR